MSITYNDLIARAQQVRDESEIGANTATRVGQLLADIIQWCQDNNADLGDYLLNFTAHLNESGGILNWFQSRIVLLKTMGGAYDDVSVGSLSDGDVYYDSQGNWIREKQGSAAINGIHPSKDVFYVNLANKTAYQWDGTTFQVAIESGGDVGIIDGMGSNSTTDALSANMGRAIKAAILTLFGAMGNYCFPAGRPTLVLDGSSTVSFSVTYVNSDQHVEFDDGEGEDAPTTADLLDTITVHLSTDNNLYVINEDSVKVYMGGDEVAGAYDPTTDTITVNNVTGNVVIVAESMTYVGYGEQNSPLVLHLDGKNQGETAGQWENLCNANKPLVLNGGYTQNDDSITFNGTTGYGIIDGLNLNLPYLSSTSEGVCKQTDQTPPQAIMVNGYDLNTVLSLVKLNQNYAEMGCCTIKEGTSSPPAGSRSGFIETSSGYVYGTGQVHHFVNYGNAMRIDNVDLSLSTAGTGQGVIIGVAGSTHDSTGDLCVGGYISRMNTLVQTFKGTIYAVRAYSRILTDAEMTQNHKVDKKRFNIA